MRDLLDELDRWRAEGVPVAIARVVDLDGSGPRAPGAAMAVNGGGEVIGSVSGGCVEGAVVTEALELLAAEEASGDAAGGRCRLSTFGYSDDQAFAVGLTCGGTIHLFLEALAFEAPFEALLAAIERDDACALLTVIDGPNAGAKVLVTSGDEPPVGTLGTAELDRVAVRDALGELASGQNAIRHYGECGE